MMSRRPGGDGPFGRKGMRGTMRLLPQLAIIAGLALVAVPLAARFLPAAHPVLDRVGLLQPMAAMGLVPAAGDGGASGSRPGGGGPPGAAGAACR